MIKNYSIGSYPGNYDKEDVGAGVNLVELINPSSDIIYMEIYTIGEAIIKVNDGEPVVLMPHGEYNGEEIFSVVLSDIRVKKVEFLDNATILNIGYKNV